MLKLKYIIDIINKIGNNLIEIFHKFIDKIAFGIIKIFYKYKEYKNYFIINDTILFKPNYNRSIKKYLNSIKFCKKIIFLDSSEPIFLSYNMNNFIRSKQIYMMRTVNLYNNTLPKLPSQITYIKFGYKFNSSIYNLHEGLTHLIFGFGFNKTVDLLPQTITHLVFGYKFNKSINNLPLKIIYLILGEKFSQSVDYLPSSIELIIFECINNNMILFDNLPTNIKSLNIKSFQFEINFDVLPNSIETIFLPIKYDKKINKLPKNIKTIECSINYPYLLEFNKKINICFYEYNNKIAKTLVIMTIFLFMHIIYRSCFGPVPIWLFLIINLFQIYIHLTCDKIHLNFDNYILKLFLFKCN